jgi:DNA repair protein RadC
MKKRIYKTPAAEYTLTLREDGYTSIAATEPADAWQFWQDSITLAPWFRPDRECLVTMHLSTRYRITGFHLVSLGLLNETASHPREIFREAIVTNSYAIIIAHNHPTGDPSPSEADRRITRQVQQGSDILGIRLMDHIIIGTTAPDRPPYFSFREASLL